MLTKILHNLLFCLFISQAVSSQAPSIDWQRSYGGSKVDRATAIQQTTDGGYIVAGFSESSDGDITHAFGLHDYWIVKMDASGTMDWEKSLGGSNTDQARSIQQTTDGGYIVAGYTLSTDGCIKTKHLANDYWLIKMKSNGDTAWQRTFGGDGIDIANCVKQTADGGYIIAGTSDSDNGDVSGNHGSSDFWIVKLDINGAIVWQRSLGGSGSENGTSIQQTTDGGYIVAGTTASTDGDVTGNHGASDYWIVKLTSNGSIGWQKTLGGAGLDNAFSVQQISDGGYIIAGSSASTDGDITGNHGGFDYWIIRLDNSGNMAWQKALGGTSDDNALGVHQTLDGGFIIAGYVLSTDGDITGNHGLYDYWIVKLRSGGTLAWQKTLGGNSFDQGSDIWPTYDGGYIATGYSNSNNNGDVGAIHAIQDYWVIKLGPDVSVPITLDKLDAIQQDKSVLCSWQTMQEQNSSHFVIERSDDGVNFIPTGKVAAAGNSSIVHKYSFTDKDAFATAKENLYYRLKMIDKDGSFTYSNTVNVKLKYPFSLSIYPNPVADKLQVDFISPVKEKASFIVTDLAGRTLYKQDALLEKGNNTLVIPVSWLADGVYVLLVSGSNKYRGRFIKTK